MSHDAEAEDIALSIVCLYAARLIEEDLWSHIANCPAFMKVVLLEGVLNVHREPKVY